MEGLMLSGSKFFWSVYFTVHMIDIKWMTVSKHDLTQGAHHTQKNYTALNQPYTAKLCKLPSAHAIQVLKAHVYFTSHIA